jgi:hypothetical protein
MESVNRGVTVENMTRQREENTQHRSKGTREVRS